MDPTKNPVDPNRLEMTSNLSQDVESGSANANIVEDKPSMLYLEPSSSSTEETVGLNFPKIDPRPTQDDQDHAESLLADMVLEFATPRLESTPAQPLKFDIGLINNEDKPEARHYDERDFQSHRREGFAQTHQPLRPIHSIRSGRSRKLSTTSSTSRIMGTSMGGVSGSGSTSNEYSDDLMVTQSEGQIIGLVSSSIDAIEEEEIPESWPLLQDNSPVSLQKNKTTTTSSGYEDFMDSPLKKVQFEVGGSPYHSATEDNDPNIERRKHQIRTPKYEDPQWRLRQGSDMPLLLRDLDNSQRPELGMSDMPEHDKDELSSHRFEDTKGFRRHKFYAREQDNTGGTGGGGGGGGGNSGGFVNFGPKNSKYDHQPHEIFVELDMLSGQGEDREWQETARWIKYEEDLEEGADRWGKPHVASLSFHSLINLRKLLESGVVLMDLEERDLPGVAYRVVDQMGMNDLIEAEEKATVLRSLLLKHKHVHEGGKWSFSTRRNSGSMTSLHTVVDDRNRPRGQVSAYSLEPTIVQRRNSSAVARMIRNDSMLGQAGGGVNNSQNILLNQQQQQHVGGEQSLREFKSTPTHIALDMTKLSGSGISHEDIRWMTNKEAILRRIPTGAEASIVLVGKDDSLRSPTLAFTRLAESVYMPNITEIPIPVRFVFILMGPSSSDLDYKEIGRSISTLMSNPQFYSIAYRADTRKDLLKGIHEFLDESIVLPPGDWDDKLFPFEDLGQKSRDIRMRKQRRSTIRQAALQGVDIPDYQKPSRDTIPPDDDPFKRTRKCFGGLENDMKRRYKMYWSDIRDGLNMQCVATIICLYFAAVSGAIAFGGLMAKKTEDYIGITETLIGTCIGGIIFAFGSGQPLLIVGTTGPLLIFDESLFLFCKSVNMSGLQFLCIRTWIGLWMTLIGLLVAFFEGAVIVRYFTRFTIEIFATYISLVFIVESLKSLAQIYLDHPLMITYGACLDGEVKEDLHRPNVALLATILMLGTFFIAHFLRKFRNSGYLTKSLRKLLGNFAVLIGIILMSLLDLLIRSTNTDKLEIPNAVEEGLRNSHDNRTWLIYPFNLELYWIGFSILPAMLLYILVFMETSIAELLVGKKEMKLLKGSGYHLDIVLICVVNTILGFLGTCWISSAIVRCVAHTVYLTVYSTNNPPGEKPKILGVKEQRVTALVVSILIGLSVLMTDILKLIPMSVLFGVFLFMGVSSLTGIQFVKRILLLFKQVQNHPQVPYVRRVRMWKMHTFTLIQIGALVCVWAVKESPGALALPIIIILLIPFRLHLLKLWFTPLELAALDAQGLEVEEPREKIGTIPLPSLDKVNKNGGIFQVEENGKNTTMNGTVHDFRSI